MSKTLIIAEKPSVAVDIAKALGGSKRPTEIPEELSLSVKTVSTYRSRKLQKINLSTNPQPSALAFPALRAFAFAPLLGQLRALAAAETQLREANRTPEQRVQERERLIASLQEALAGVKQLSGLLPICAGCKKIRNDPGGGAHRFTAGPRHP